MDVVDAWTGQSACVLQTALRDSNETFAERLGVAVRTVAKWHSNPAVTPRWEIQQALDTTYERADAPVRTRFTNLSRPAPSGSSPQPQVLRVAIAVVVRDHREVLLVCRRDGAEIRWQFPAGVVKPGGASQSVMVQETHAETGVHCTTRAHLGSRLHPVTGVFADYYLADHLSGDAENRDVLENVDVSWVPIADLTRFIPRDHIYPSALAALEEEHD